MNKSEAWMRGPVPGITPFLQPVAHALLQARDDVALYTLDCRNFILWKRPKDVASVGFHLRHMTGVLDRLFTYAENKQLSEIQLEYLAKEGIPLENDRFLDSFRNSVRRLILRL